MRCRPYYYFYDLLINSVNTLKVLNLIDVGKLDQGLTNFNYSIACHTRRDINFINFFSKRVFII